MFHKYSYLDLKKKNSKNVVDTAFTWTPEPDVKCLE